MQKVFHTIKNSEKNNSTGLNVATAIAAAAAVMAAVTYAVSASAEQEWIRVGGGAAAAAATAAGDAQALGAHVQFNLFGFGDNITLDADAVVADAELAASAFIESAGQVVDEVGQRCKAERQKNLRFARNLEEKKRCKLNLFAVKFYCELLPR